MEYSKEDFINLIKSMPDDTAFNMKIHWEDYGDELISYAHFESNYKLGQLDSIKL